jgi:plasmid stabilization system protein ParE
MKIIIEPFAAAQIQKERVWLVNNRGAIRAEAFEDELRHILDLMADNPEMGHAAPDRVNQRRMFLRGCGYFVYYRLYREADELRVVRIRHQRQRPLKRVE